LAYAFEPVAEMTSFKEAEQMLVAWHHDDLACVDKDYWRQCFDRNYRPWEAARYAAELLRQRATAPVAKG
jgi:hypothetical protein